jgi:hypothetical protein
MNTSVHYYLRGLGASPADTAVQLSTATAGAVVPTLVGSTVATTLGLGGSTAGVATAAGISLAIPIVGAAIAALSIGIELILHSGCGQTCIVTSQWANQAEKYLQQNIAAYFAIPAPRPQSVQQLAMANFQAIWNTLVQQCSQPGLGTAGQNCISDRAAGACKWKATSQEYPGQPAVGACWNWWNGYYNPIANDPNVVASPPITAVASSAAADVTSVLSGAGGIPVPLLVAAAVVLGWVVLE